MKKPPGKAVERRMASDLSSQAPAANPDFVTQTAEVGRFTRSVSVAFTVAMYPATRFRVVVVSTRIDKGSWTAPMLDVGLSNVTDVFHFDASGWAVLREAVDRAFLLFAETFPS